MDREKRMRAWIRAEVMLLFIMMGAFLLRETGRTESMEQAVVTATSAAGKDYIKWVDFTVSYEALCQAYDWDVDTFDTEHHVEWIPLLAYTAARTGGEFDKKALKILNETAEKLAEGEAEIETLTKDMKYYQDVIKTVDNWQYEIFNYFTCRITNAYTESLNNLIKNIEKAGRGYSFEVLRAKVLFGTSATRKPKYTRANTSNKSYSFTTLFTWEDLVGSTKLTEGFGVDIPQLLEVLESDKF